MPKRAQGYERPARQAIPHGATVVLVLGMHRSGTSAVARLLNLRGAEIGHDLLQAKEDNERGFWENRTVLELHESLLRELGLRWHDLTALPPDWSQSAPARRFVARLPEVLAAQFAGAGLFVVKDPRLSRFAPLWIEALAATGVRPAFVFTVRHPDEVAASLARRDGFAVTHSQVLWLRHLVEGERATRGCARVFVHYERLLADWRGELDRIGEQLALSWPPAPEGFAAAADAFLAPALRHHHHAANTPLPAIVARVYARVCAATSGRAPASLFDDSEFDDVMQLIGPLYREFDARQRNADDQHAREIERARAASAEKDAEIDAARSNIDALTREIGQARSAFAARDAEIDAARGVIAGKDAEIDAARRNIEALAAEIDGARENIEKLTGDLNQAELVCEQQKHEFDARIESLAAQIDTARKALAAKDAEIDTARDGIAAKDAEIDAARRNIDGLVAEFDSLRHSRWFRLGHSLRLLGGRKA
jgi:hypothetical protein